MDRSGRAQNANLPASAAALGSSARADDAGRAARRSGPTGRRRSIGSSRNTSRRTETAKPTLRFGCAFARRVYLDVWGLLPTPEQLQQFLDDPHADKRAALVAALLADDQNYAEHWMSFWNDLLRNEDGVTYFSETAGRKSISDWLFASLKTQPPVRSIRHAAAESEGCRPIRTGSWSA